MDDCTFDLGVALAGASTGGAYAAGVLDFLYQALRELDAARADGRASWGVRARVLAGSSAGGLTAAVGLAGVNGRVEAVPNVEVPSLDERIGNVFYRAWVLDMGFEGMFGTGDLLDGEDVVRGEDGRAVLPSVLNAAYLSKRTAKRFAEIRPERGVPAWAPERVLLTTTNLRGVPYELRFRGARDGAAGAHRMLRHLDHVIFTRAPADASFAVDMSAARDSASWARLLAAANATSAFPGVFPAVLLERPLAHMSAQGLGAPAWPPGMPAAYRYAAVDGGVLANEPFALCRGALEAARGAALDGRPEHAWGTVLLVDPFPSDETLDPADEVPPRSVAATFAAMVSAMRGQATFQADELRRVADGADAGVFMLAPARAGRRALACGGLRGFAGVLDVRLRAHDFMLGRRNCQRFLREHLVLDAAAAARNPLFGAAARAFKDERGCVPVVPLFGGAAEECVLPAWPVLDQGMRDGILRRFGDGVRERARALFVTVARDHGVLVDAHFLHPRRLMNAAVLRVARWLANACATHVVPAVEKVLDEFK